MIDTQRIQQVSDEIARRFHPGRIILGGSYAYGTATEDPEVDLLVVMPSEGRVLYEASHAGVGDKADGDWTSLDGLPG